MHNVFLETHNIKNLYSGFGQFNMQLLKAIKEINDPDLKFTIHTSFENLIKRKFGTYFTYKVYLGARRYKMTRVRKKYDVWHSVNQNTKIEPFNKIPYVLTVHDVNFIEEISNNMDHERNILFKEKIERAHAITYISEFAKQSTHQHFKIPEGMPEYVIYNGNPTSEFIDLTGFTTNINTEQPYLFALGDFLERKNFHLLVEMLQHLPELNLIIAGNSDRPYGAVVLEKIESLSLQNRVFLTGRISEKEKQFYLKNCTAFVYPSLREGFGLPIIEAMKFGIPIMLANTSSLPEIGGEHAFYWNELEPKKMAHTLLESLKTYNNNPSFYKNKYIERANSFTWENAAKQYIDVYKTVIKNAKRN
ncbi:glycosyltransferase family 4 protein [Mariniflexile gromovii]|uniref:Glycosyltransferase family 4 protein n=1 Tax=Mariniflexile gromovii TaxID=362523 RepID=A0ABS4BTJ0_9FLAO|nr:glycosyltransferase family 1 protein [Mariniflexile gromovii]MBP0903899.1 glycosyltransferase family 4 protein [Mariniflexile gromovii]